MLSKLLSQMIIFTIWLRWSTPPIRNKRIMSVIFVGFFFLIGFFLLLARPFLPVVRSDALTFAGIGTLFGMCFISDSTFCLFVSLALDGFIDYTYYKKEGKELYHGKKLWDWLQLLIIPVVLTGSALLFNFQNARVQQDIAEDNQREVALQKYFDDMSQLILDRQLLSSKPGDVTSDLARTRTLSTLRRVEAERKGVIIRFLSDAGLMEIVSLERANLAYTPLGDVSISNSTLTFADMHGASLDHADLHGSNAFSVNLSHADLKFANLTKVYLVSADLSFTDLSFSKLSNAFLSYANLSGAVLTDVDLSFADLQGAILVDTDLSFADLHNATLSGADLSLTFRLSRHSEAGRTEPEV
ncbi:pentapeptide repeat-containing protein [bacterium]|nr:pentapeptide repeat-containing protein [bacterium]